MGSSEKNKIVLGIVGAVGVFVVGFLVYKKCGGCESEPEDERIRKKRKNSHPSGNVSPQIQAQEEKTESVKQAVETTEGKLLQLKSHEEEDPNQMSFVVLNQNVENQSASSKKSDRSSDESSYDVVEAEEVETEDVQESHDDNDKTSREKEFEESLSDVNEESSIIVDAMNESEIEASSSSFYHSAEETLGRDRIEGGKNTSDHVSTYEGYFSTDHSHCEIPSQHDDNQSSSDSFTYPDKSNIDSVIESEKPVIIWSDKKCHQSEGGKDTEDTSVSMYTATASLTLSKEGEPITKTAKPQISLVQSPALTGAKPVFIPDDEVPASHHHSETAGIPAVVTEIDVYDKELDAEEITAVLTACQNTPMSVTKDQIRVLVLLLKKKNVTLHPTILDSVMRVSAFTQNNTNLRSAGCEFILCQQVVDECDSILKSGLQDDTQLTSLTNVLTNLSMDPKATINLEKCVSPLINVLIKMSMPEMVQLSILRPLINLCSQDHFHSYYTPAISYLYSMLDSGSYNMRVQSVKVLVNLSLNEIMVPYMLAARACNSLLDLLDRPTHPDIILRVLTMLGNLRSAVAKLNIDQSSLPSAYKAESPKTMYTALCGVVKVPLLRNKVSRLTRHSDEDIRLQASKLYTIISIVKK